MMNRLVEFLKLKMRGEYSIRLLEKRGLKVGGNFGSNIGVIIDPDHCWLIEIGDNVVFGPRVHILAHDASTGIHSNYTKIGRVKIGDNVFVGASAIVLPDVTIGDNVIIGAGSVVSRSIPSNVVAAGSPAKEICTINQFKNKYQRLMNERPLYNEEWTLRKSITSKMKTKQKEALANGFGFVE
jgi:maltose O-acetyltransferase